MTKLSLVLAPDPIYTKISDKVEIIDDSIHKLANDMIEFLEDQHAYGLAAPMFGISKRVIAVHNEVESLIMINPNIVFASEEKETLAEQSLSFLDVEVEVSRSASVKVEFLTLENTIKTIEANGMFARCIQHEIDYLNGITLLNYVYSLTRKDMLTRRMIKLKKLGYRPHIHSSSCNH